MILLTISTNSGPVNNYMLPHSPFVWRYTFSFNDWPEYFSDWDSVDTPPSLRLNISGVSILLNNYTEKESLSDCIGDEESWFFDFGAQTLYVHVNHLNIPASIPLSIFKVSGFTDSGVYYDENDVEYQPLLKSSPSIRFKADPLEYKKISFQTQRFTLSNENGDFDNYIDSPVPGGVSSVYFIPESGGEVFGGVDSYILSFTTDIMMGTEDNVAYRQYTGVVSADSLSETEFNVSLKDIRSGTKILIPPNKFSITDYADMPDSYVGKVITDGYGYCRGVRAAPITGNIIASPVVYKFCEVATSIDAVYVKKNDTWTEVTPTATDLANGEFTLAIADCVDGDTTLECKVDGVLRDIHNPGEIIADMNERFGGITYDGSNYDIPTWESESAKLADIGLCMTEQKDLIDWIEKIQNGSDYGFLYAINGDGERYLIVDDAEKGVSTPILDIPCCDIVSEISFSRDFSKFASSVQVKYSKDCESNTYLSVTNTDFESYVTVKYRYAQEVTRDTLLVNEADALVSAEYFAMRYKDVTPEYSITLTGNQYFRLRLYDVVTVLLDKITRPFAGTKTCQVLGISFDLKNELVNVDLKEL